MSLAVDLSNLDAFYENAGRACGGELHCPMCDAHAACSPEEAAGYLRTGWPRCCGYTMLLFPAAEPAAEGGGA